MAGKDQSPTLSACGARIGAVILAAGESSRMGSPKALLAWRGTTSLEYLARLFADAALDPVAAVLGHQAALIRGSVKLPPRTRVVVNAQYQAGQLSSLQAGIRAVCSDPLDGLLVHPVDSPALSPAVLRALLTVFGAERPDIMVPSHNHRRGHPVIFSSRLLAELLAAPPDQGARAVFPSHDIRHVEVEDPGVLADIDDPAAYQKWRSWTPG